MERKDGLIENKMRKTRKFKGMNCDNMEKALDEGLKIVIRYLNSANLKPE